MSELIATTGPRNGDSPLTVALTELGSVDLQSARAVFDGSLASGSFLACLTIRAQDGTILARCFNSTVVAAGESAEVSWFPGVEESQSVDPVTAVASPPWSGYPDGFYGGRIREDATPSPGYSNADRYTLGPDDFFADRLYADNPSTAGNRFHGRYFDISSEANQQFIFDHEYTLNLAQSAWAQMEDLYINTDGVCTLYGRKWDASHIGFAALVRGDDLTIHADSVSDVIGYKLDVRQSDSSALTALPYGGLWSVESQDGPATGLKATVTGSNGAGSADGKPAFGVWGIANTDEGAAIAGRFEANQASPSAGSWQCQAIYGVANGDAAGNVIRSVVGATLQGRDAASGGGTNHGYGAFAYGTRSAILTEAGKYGIELTQAAGDSACIYFAPFVVGINTAPTTPDTALLLYAELNGVTWHLKAYAGGVVHTIF